MAKNSSVFRGVLAILLSFFAVACSESGSKGDTVGGDVAASGVCAAGCARLLECGACPKDTAGECVTKEACTQQCMADEGAASATLVNGVASAANCDGVMLCKANADAAAAGGEGGDPGVEIEGGAGESGGEADPQTE